MDNSNNTKKSTETKPSALVHIQKPLVSNPLSFLWTASLLIGGIILWFYFFEIKYFPDLNLHESLLYILLATTAGIFYLTSLSLLLMSPYIIRWLNNFATNSQSFNEDINKVIANNSYQKVNWYFFSQFLVVFAITTFFFLEYKYKNPFLSYGIAAFILLVTLIGYLGVHSDKNYKEWIELNLKKLIFCFFKKTDKENNNFKKLFTGIINFLFWSFSLVITFSLLLTSIKMATMFSSDVSVSQHFLITISLLLIVLCSNLIFALLHESEKKPWWLWAIPFILVLLIFFIVRDFPIPRNVMKNFQLGNITAEQIILNSEGCKILKGFDQNYLQHKESCTLINYKILSRLGHSFYIETPPCKPPWIYCNPLRFTIPSNHVLSWSMVKPDKEKLTETKGDLKPTKTPDDPKK